MKPAPLSIILAFLLFSNHGAPAPAQDALAQKYDELRGSIVQIECRYFLERAFLDLAKRRMQPAAYEEFMREMGGAIPAHGTGFFIDSKGTIVTNSHVVSPIMDEIVVNNQRYRATLGDVHIICDIKGEKVKVRAHVRARNQWYDVAILTVPLTGMTPLALDFEARPAVGDGVLVPGFPMGVAPAEVLQHAGAQRASNYKQYPDMTLNTGRVSAIIASRAEDEMLIQIDARVNPGNSGGPLLIEGDHVAGIITYKISQAEGLGYAIPVWLVRDFLSTAMSDSATTGDVVMNMEIVSPAPDAGDARGSVNLAAAASALKPLPSAPPASRSRYFAPAGDGADLGRWSGFTAAVYPADDYAALCPSPDAAAALVTSQAMSRYVRWPLHYFIVQAKNGSARKIKLDATMVTLHLSDGSTARAMALGSIADIAALPAAWRGVFKAPALKPGEAAAFVVCSDAKNTPEKIAAISIALDAKTELTLQAREP